MAQLYVFLLRFLVALLSPLGLPGGEGVELAWTAGVIPERVELERFICLTSLVDPSRRREALSPAGWLRTVYDRDVVVREIDITGGPPLSPAFRPLPREGRWRSTVVHSSSWALSQPCTPFRRTVTQEHLVMRKHASP